MELCSIRSFFFETINQLTVSKYQLIIMIDLIPTLCIWPDNKLFRLSFELLYFSENVCSFVMSQRAPLLLSCGWWTCLIVALKSPSAEGTTQAQSRHFHKRVLTTQGVVYTSFRHLEIFLRSMFVQTFHIQKKKTTFINPTVGKFKALKQ